MAIHKVTVRGVTYDIGDEPFVLPVATAETIGGVKIGDGINIAEDGTISNVGSFVVNFNYDESADTYSADKTFAEIQDAIQKGYYVCGIYDETFFNLNTYSETYNDLTFNSLFVEEDSKLGNPTLYREFYINSANEIEYYEVENKIPSSEGSGGGSEWNLVLDTVINDNIEYQPLTLDYETGVMTFENGAPTDYPKGLIPNFQIGETTTDAWKYVPNEFLVPSDNQGWLVSSEGIYGGVTAISTGTVNSNVDVTKFHFEKIASVAHTWNGLQCNKLKLEILAPNMKCWAYNSNIAFRLLLSDGSTYSLYTAYEDTPAHKSLQTFVGECYIIHNKLWVKTHSRKNILKARTSTSVLGTITDSATGFNLGRSLSDGVYIVGIDTTSRSNQQSGMYNGTVIRIWEG